MLEQLAAHMECSTTDYMDRVRREAFPDYPLVRSASGVNWVDEVLECCR